MLSAELQGCAFLCSERHVQIFSICSGTLQSSSSKFVLFSVPSKSIAQPDVILLLKALHFQIWCSISVLKVFRLSDCSECLNLEVEQLIKNENIPKFVSEKVM